MPGTVRASVFFVTATALLCGFVVDPALSNVNTGQVEALWKDYVVAEKRFQFDLARLLGQQWPELQGVAGLQRDQQFAVIEMRNMKFEYLLKFDPERIEYGEGLSRFANFEWTEADSEALRASNPYFAKMEQWEETTSKRLSEHPDVAVAGEKLTALQTDERYRSMVERYQARMDDLESALTSISKANKRSERTKALKSQIGR